MVFWLGQGRWKNKFDFFLYYMGNVCVYDRIHKFILFLLCIYTHIYIYKYKHSVGGTSAHTLTQAAMVDGFKQTCLPTHCVFWGKKLFGFEKKMKFRLFIIFVFVMCRYNVIYYYGGRVGLGKCCGFALCTIARTQHFRDHTP